jgi:hypothetical protein
MALFPERSRKEDFGAALRRGSGHLSGLALAE